MHKYTITSILDPSNLSQTPDISSRLSNQFVLYIVNLRQIYPKPLFYPQIPNDRSEYKIEVIVYMYDLEIGLDPGFFHYKYFSRIILLSEFVYFAVNERF